MLISAYTVDQFKEVEEFLKLGMEEYWKMWTEAEWSATDYVIVKRDSAPNSIVLPMDTIISVKFTPIGKDGRYTECTARGKLGKYQVLAIITNIISSDSGVTVTVSSFGTK